MDYKKIYDSLISRATDRVLDEYYEVHHIIPRCMGGTDDDNNLVKLTAREHFVAHQLLVKTSNGNIALIKAAMMMCVGQDRRPNNRQYAWLKEKYSIAQSIKQTGSGNTNFGTRWMVNWKTEEIIKADQEEFDRLMKTGDYVHGKVFKLCDSCGIGVRRKYKFCDNCRLDGRGNSIKNMLANRDDDKKKEIQAKQRDTMSIGEYHTPHGVFMSATQFVAQTGRNAKTLKKYCKSSDEKYKDWIFIPKK